jgi:lysophospholipase L1-like esterase
VLLFVIIIFVISNRSFQRNGGFMKGFLNTFKIILIILFTIPFLFQCISTDKEVSFEQKPVEWIVTWGTAQQLTEPHNLPPAPGLQDNTLRQIIHVSVGGERIRLKFSNAFTNTPVVMDSVTVAYSTGKGSIDDWNIMELTFQGNTQATIPPHEEIYSDPMDFSLMPQSDLAVSIYFSSIDEENITGHPGSRCTSYIKSGNVTTFPNFSSAAKVKHWYILAGLEVWAPGTGATLVIAGDSITDGRGSTPDRNDRWPDALARRLLANPATGHIGVYNAGIGGNCVVRGGLGPTLKKRLERDVLNQPGVRWLIVMEGVNDIGSIKSEEAAEYMEGALIEAYREIIQKAHDASIYVYGATITPFGRSFYDRPIREALREKINTWIRTSGEFDAVIDMDKAVRNPGTPTELKPIADSGDNLHLSPKGYQMMADTVDINLFTQ